jgi:hypothetical protein
VGSIEDDAGWDAGSEAGAAVRGPYGARVVRFEPGEGATFGHARMPDVVLGPPRGGGDMAGGTDVVSLGAGGTLCLAFEGAVIDGPGVDLIVFENAFTVAGSDRGFVELGEVSVSEDGERFVSFPCNGAATSAPFTGCAGWNPVYSSPSNGLSPTDPRVAGGDPFDLAEVGLASARVVCVRDLRTQAPAPPSTGFDLDAVAAVHYREP